MPHSRQLAAIMFADIVGYTAMMQKDETLTLNLRDKLKKKLESETALHGGKIVKFSGDGALCSFGSAIESIRAAISVQLFMQQEPIVPLRIGVHQADVVFEDGDVHGDGVNIASRLESLATQGSIFISAKVHDDIKNHKDIQTVSLGKYVLKNVTEPIEIFSISNHGIEVPLHRKLQGKGVKYIKDKITFRKKTLFYKLLIATVIISVLGYLIITPIVKKQYARNNLLPAIQKLVDENFFPPIAAYDMSLEAEKFIPNDSTLITLWSTIAPNVSIVTEPAGAEIYWKDYTTPEAAWRSSGSTPLIEVRLPRVFKRIEIRKEGYQTIEYAGIANWGKLGSDKVPLKMDAIGSLPKNMIRIPKSLPGMQLSGLLQEHEKQVREFLIDKYEVTNEQFKEFIDAGGYTTASFWEYPFYSNGQEITSKAAFAKFVDKTGRQGPANWEVGTYPNGMGNHPVTGVSWYEAAAYASFANKQLPTVFHWNAVVQSFWADFIVPLSNYNGKATVPVGRMSGYNSFGVYDLAGNAREWCFNESDQIGQRFILGGGWNDATYAFSDAIAQPAMDRSITNGFRCIKALPGDITLPQLKVTVDALFRDYKNEKPVDDKTFALYLNQFNYDKKPLKPKVEETIERDSWKAEKITYDAGYSNERMQAWVYSPKGVDPPYQTVIFFPGAHVIYSNSFDPNKIHTISGGSDFILKSGRVFVYPIYIGTHERSDDLEHDVPEETVFYKDHVVMWGKEFRRTIDYLESRSDIRGEKIGYLGWSWGGYMGGIIPAIEKRIKVVVLNVGGMGMTKALPEVDQLNYLPRVTQPTLMLNGKHDMFFPVETSQKPMYDLLGTPPEEKKIIIYPSGHLVPRADFVKESLLWFDHYLGPVN